MVNFRLSQLYFSTLFYEEISVIRKQAIYHTIKNIRLGHIQPEKPQQNTYIERYNRTVRYDWLAQYLFATIEKVQKYATCWLWLYNNERPNTEIGGITPRQKLGMAV